VWDGEIRLADGLISMQKDRDIYGLEVEGIRYDAWSKLGYLQASIAYGLKDPELRDDILDFIKVLSS